MCRRLVVFIACAILATISAAAQQKAAAKATPGPTPRTADGKVDFSGIWSADPHFISDLNDALKPGESIPLQPWAAKAGQGALIERRPDGSVPSRRRSAPSAASLAHRANAHAYFRPLRGQHPQLPPDFHGRPSASRRSRPHLVRPLHRQNGRRHLRRGLSRLQRSLLVRFRRPSAHRQIAYHRALPAAGF